MELEFLYQLSYRRGGLTLYNLPVIYHLLNRISVSSFWGQTLLGSRIRGWNSSLSQRPSESYRLLPPSILGSSAIRVAGAMVESPCKFSVDLRWNRHVGAWWWIKTYSYTSYLGGWISINPSYFDVNYRATTGQVSTGPDLVVLQSLWKPCWT